MPDNVQYKYHSPIVFIHGTGDSARIWRQQLDYFGPERAVAIDLPGHGERADSLPERTGVEEYGRAVHEIVGDELRLDHPIIAGHSLGGAIALMMGLEYGEELGGLILIGTGARLRVLPELLEAARTMPQKAVLQLKVMALASGTPVSMSSELMDEQMMPGANVLYRDLAACNGFDCMGRLSEIRLPTLIICGAEDRLTPVKYSQFLHEHIAGSMLRVIPGAGHYVFREKPEAVNLAIEDWLEG